VVGELAAEYYNPTSDKSKTAQTVGFAKVIAAVAGLIAGGGGDNAAAVNIAATAGANAAENNKMLHPKAMQRIQDLAKGDPQKEARLAAAACALVRCSDGVPKDDPTYAYLKKMQDAGENLSDEKTLLSKQTAYIARNPNAPLFSYTGVDEYIIDPFTQSKGGTRLAGATQATVGAVGVGASGTLCTTGLGCVLGAVTGTVSADYMVAGVKQTATGNATLPYGEQVLQSLGLSPQAAAYTYAVLGMTPAAVDAVIVNRAINAQAAANAWARGTYTGESAITVEGRVYRFSDPKFADKTWEIYPGNVNSNFRYSEPGIGSIYSGTGVQTSAAEVRSYVKPGEPFQPKTLVAGDVRIDRVLDLTDPAALKALGVTREQITQSSHGVNGAYTQTQRIAEWAREQGYNGILAPSAQTRTGTNLITFDNTQVTNIKVSPPAPTSVTPPAWK
jgi:filamentous hemagglutinin